MLIRATTLSRRNTLELPDFWREVVWGVARQQVAVCSRTCPQSAGGSGESAGLLSFFTALLSEGMAQGGLNQPQTHPRRVEGLFKP